jgi:hypothetical protein
VVFRLITTHSTVCFLFAGDFGGSSSSPSAGGEFKRGAKPDRKVKKKFGQDEDKTRRTTSLRIGTGKKGRRAQVSGRRGSLKKRDRSADKERRADAALERNTVFLPE